MAFNLEKGGDDKKKFDLSKSSAGTDVKTTAAPTPSNTENKKKYGWAFAMVVVLLLAIGIWYFSTRNSSGDTHSSASTPAGQPEATNTASQASNEKKSIDSANPKKAAPSPDKTVDTPATNSNAAARITSVSHDTKNAASFEAGSANLGEVDDKAVKDILAYLLAHPQVTLTVYGYASSEGDVSFNQALSQQRADALKKYLVEKGVDPKRINTVAKGINNPIASNDTEEGRKKNRRVEFGF
jgi:outer membrane protein OmpA-like peptidoglycan-associated protein